MATKRRARAKSKPAKKPRAARVASSSLRAGSPPSTRSRTAALTREPPIIADTATSLPVDVDLLALKYPPISETRSFISDVPHGTFDAANDDNELFVARLKPLPPKRHRNWIGITLIVVGICVALGVGFAP